MLPTEFKIFDWGANESDNGTVYVSRDTAEAIVRRRGARDVMIDLEHLSLENGPDKDLDAYGWGELAIKEDGLYIIGCTWTDDGADRLKSKRQRYVSPAFTTDERNRVVSIINVALTALPAMRHLSALVAASIKRRKMSLTDMMAEMAAALENGDPQKALEVYAAMAEPLQEMVEESAPESEEPSGAEEASSDEEPEEASSDEEPKEMSKAELEEMAAKLGYRLAALDEEEEKARTDSIADLREEVSTLRKRLEAKEKKISARPVARKDSVTITEEDRRTSKMLGLPLEQVVKFRNQFGGKN